MDMTRLFTGQDIPAHATDAAVMTAWANCRVNLEQEAARNGIQICEHVLGYASREE